MQQQKIRVRFAPSPTGHPHLGNLRSMLFNWLFARHNGGKFLMRIEDTDVARSKPEYVQSILASMDWLGVSSDEPIVYQMARIHEHQQAAYNLVKQGLAYPCFCQPRDADDVIFDLEHGVGCKYPGTCRNKPYTEQDLQRPHAIRFRLPDDVTKIEYEDLVLGKVTVGADQLDDFVIMRRDGTPVYNFCVVVDDIFMRITHVIRGQDHVSNTPKQLLFYQALGATPPAFAHMPLILGPGGVKLSKRDAGTSIHEYRMQGFLPEALFNYFVRLGWSHGDQEIFTREQMVEFFTLDAVGKNGASFDPDKLKWLNGYYIRSASALRLRSAIKDMGTQQLPWSESELDRLLDLYKERSTTLIEITEGICAFAQDEPVLDLNLLDKWRTAGMVSVFALFAQELAKIEAFTSEALLELAKNVCAQQGEKLVTLAQPLRLALTGSVASPGIFELLAILGKERALGRVKRILMVM